MKKLPFTINPLTNFQQLIYYSIFLTHSDGIRSISSHQTFNWKRTDVDIRWSSEYFSFKIKWYSIILVKIFFFSKKKKQGFVEHAISAFNEWSQIVGTSTYFITLYSDFKNSKSLHHEYQVFEFSSNAWSMNKKLYNIGYIVEWLENLFFDIIDMVTYTTGHSGINV